jgi:hypothetical protein
MEQALAWQHTVQVIDSATVLMLFQQQMVARS